MDLPQIAWGLPDARWSPPLPGLAAFTATPLHAMLRAAALRHPEAVALVARSGRLSHGETFALAERSAAAVAARLPPGAPVACLLPAQPAGVAALLGVLISGRPALLLNPQEPLERLAALLADARPGLLLTEAPPALGALPPVLTLAELLAAPALPWTPDLPWDPDAPCSVHFTSGSTGRPKGIVLSARGLLARTLEVMAHWSLNAEAAVLALSQTGTSAGLAFTLATLLAGARGLVISVAVEGVGAVLRLAEQEGVTHCAAGPAMWRVLLRPEAARGAFRRLRLLRSGNAPVLCEELAAWRALLPPDCVAQHTLASTEAQVIAQWMVPAGRLPGVSLAAGSLEPLHEMALLDEHGAAVASGEAGELVLRGPYLAVGEWRDGALVPGRLPPEPGRPGWRRFHTGDLARVEPDGLLRMLGRADRQVKINGVRVEPAEVEAVLRAEPGVADAAVLALGQPGQVVLLGAVAAPGLAPEAVSASLRQRLAASLPSAFRPARLLVLEELPRLPGAGKHDLQALRRLAEGG